MDKKLLVKIEAALDSAEAIFKEVENPTMNLGDQSAYFKAQMRAVKAARKALKDAG